MRAAVKAYQLTYFARGRCSTLHAGYYPRPLGTIGPHPGRCIGIKATVSLVLQPSATGSQVAKQGVDRVMRHLLAKLHKVTSGEAGRVALGQQVTRGIDDLWYRL